MESLLRDVRYAWVTLRRTPGLTLTVLVTIALGVGATTAVFTVVHAVLLEPLSYPDSAQLVRVWEAAAAGVDGVLLRPRPRRRRSRAAAH